MFVVLVFASSVNPKVTGFLVGHTEAAAVSVPVSASSSAPSPAPPPSSPSPAPAPTPAPPPSVVEVPPNFAGLPGKLSSDPMVQEFPEKASIALRFFTFINGNRVWQNEYIIRKGSVVEGKAQSPDVIANLHSKYVDRFYSEDFCTVVQAAKSNGDLGFDTSLGEFSLLWKFKSIAKYRHCIS